MPESNEVVIIITICIILTLLLFILSTVLVKELKKKERKIGELSKKIIGTEKEISSRNAFRVDFAVKKCEFSIIEVANQTLNDQSWKEGEIKDLSFSGMKLISDKAIPVHQRVKIKINFNLEGQDTTIVGIVVRQEVYLNEQQMVYDIQFTSDPQNQKALFNALNKIKRYREHIGAPRSQGTEKGRSKLNLPDVFSVIILGKTNH